MNKLNVLLLGLALMLAVYYVQANEEAKPENDELVNELADDDEDGEPDGSVTFRDALGKKLRDAFGGKDVIEHGVDNLHEKREAKCAKAKSEKACETCCTQHGLASTTQRSKAFFVKCTCQERLNV